MRISDWSSNVCSSDLTLIGDVENNGGELIGGNSPGIATFGGDLTMTDGSLAVELGGTGVGDFDLYQVLGSAAFESGPFEFKWEGPRSELKSLIISWYAVFALKIKKYLIKQLTIKTSELATSHNTYNK